MAILKVFYQGALVSSFSLDSNKEYRVGRDSSADINLQNDNGVSRHHLILKYQEGDWVVECVSKSMMLYKSGNQIGSIRLSNGDRFSIPGYEFEFTHESNTQVTTTGSHSQTEDKTNIGMLPSIPTLVRYDSYGQVVDTISMNGSSWIIGREPNNAIYIDHPKLSRKHFEIIRKEGRFLVRDLDSANGTFLNGKALNQNEWAHLFSGDEISVFDLKLRFILRDASFDERVQQAQNLLSPFLSSASPGAGQGGQNGSGNYEPGAIPEPDVNSNQVPLSNKKITPIRAAILLVIALAGVLYIMMGDSLDSGSTDANKIVSPFDKLTPEQQANVKQLYQSAQNFLQQGKYELARQEILKLHQIIPFYEDSKQIEDTANQGIAMIQERERLEAEAKERAAIEEKIQAQIKKCRELINPKIEMYEMDMCLAPVLEFDPTHIEIATLKAEVQRILDERAIQEAQRREYAAKVSRLKGYYNEALAFDQNQEWLKAIPAYDKVVNSALPDPTGLKALAKARGEELQQMLLLKQAEVEKKADEAYKNGDLKTAIRLIREGMVINMENQVIVGRHEEWMGELRRNMMPIYQDGILEESVGEVEAAKRKWLKIRELSLPGEDYFEKSKVKLKKYGAWK